MNIRQAKEEVKNTILAYTKKDEAGKSLIPVEKQRPLLLMGPPGIGKTEIIEQIAGELHLGLVSYTITHHTRQSAIGLPFIVQKEIDGSTYSVTEYTMSEIIGAVYDVIEKTGVREGILFLDEINCVSETLSPMMLQFLQYKTFGQFKLPEGFVVVCAGNPPEYNKSVRDFDVVTLDRLKRIDVTEDFAVWKEYGYEKNMHGAILAYLEIKKKHFYSVRMDLDGKHFVTARGWEDLSLHIKAYEKLQLPITEEVVRAFLQDNEIAKDFTDYYGLYTRYRDLYRIHEILAGDFPKDTMELKDAAFDEKLSIIGLLMEAVSEDPKNNRLENAFRFVNHVYGQNQEMVLFLTEVNRNYPLLLYITENGCKEYYHYSKLLMVEENTSNLKREIRAALEG